MTNNPAKYGGLDGFGLEVTDRVPIESVPNPENIAYLRTKRERMGHLLGGLDRRHRQRSNCDHDHRRPVCPATGVRVAIACGRFNDLITERLLKGAVDGLIRHGVADDDITVVWVPGSFELPLVAERWPPATTSTR